MNTSVDTFILSGNQKKDSKIEGLKAKQPESRSRIPVYNPKRSESLCQTPHWSTYGLKPNCVQARQLSDLPDHIKLQQHVHNRLNHMSNQRNNRSTNGHSPSSCPSITPFPSGETTPRDRSSQMTARSSTSKNKNKFEEYLPLCEVQKGMSKGEIVEGILRINPRNYKDAYISAPEGGLDIFINDLVARNRALNGDHVAVKLLEEETWLISYFVINSNWDKWSKEINQLIDQMRQNGQDLSFHFENLKLNSQNKKQVLLNYTANLLQEIEEVNKIPENDLKDCLQREYPNLPLEIYSISIGTWIKPESSVPCWTEFIQRVGKVVHIFALNHSRKAGGFIKLDKFKPNQQYVHFSPSDLRIPQIILPVNSVPKHFISNYSETKDNLFLVEITQWNETSLFPSGKIIQDLGKSGDIEVETELLLRSCDVDRSEFPLEVFEEYGQFSETWKIPEQEYEYRRDFRNECVFTIDPQSARDLDDAISLKELPNNEYEVGVHIADVSYFITEDTLLDNIAKNRATSVYLVDQVIPMLPSIFCQNLCSLNPGEDRLTFSVVFRCDAQGNVLDKWYGRTLIRSCAKLSYEHAQRMIDATDNQFTPEEFPQIYGQWSLSYIANRIKIVNEIAQQIRTRRFQSGSLRLDKHKLSFLLNENGMPISFSVYEHKDSNHLIEEWMLLANKAVASRLYDFFSKDGRAFLRAHPPFNSSSLKEFNLIYQLLDFDTSSSSNIYKSLQRLAQENRNYFQLCSMTIIKAMKLAIYLCVDHDMKPDQFNHFALNFDKYTHFTSPIRRYADLVVHRLLALSLGYSTPCGRSKDELKAIANNCNTRKYNSMQVSEKSAEIYLKAYISQIGSITSNALVLKVYDRSFEVLIIDFDIVQRVYTNQLDLKSSQFLKTKDDQQLMLMWKPRENFIEPQQLQQRITCLMEVQVEIIITESFKYNVIIAHPNGEFIHLDK